MATDIDRELARQEAVTGPSDRSFGLTFAAIFALVAAFPLLYANAPRWWALAVAATLLVVSFTRPMLLAPLNRWWLKFGLLLHKIMNPLILGLMFFLIVTPMGLLMGLFRRHPVRARPDPAAASYWVVRTPPGPEPVSMRRQF